jgi:hypothetical protein
LAVQVQPQPGAREQHAGSGGGDRRHELLDWQASDMSDDHAASDLSGDKLGTGRTSTSQSTKQ